MSAASESLFGDPGDPYLFVDLYSQDLNGRPNWSALAQAPNYVGVILKAYEGTKFNDGGWFTTNWPTVRDIGADRYSSSWFRGAYLFLKFNQPGADQADSYLQAIDTAAGWDRGDIVPIIDVELGSEKNSNRAASAQQVIDCTTACATRLRELTGKNIMLYGRGAMRDLSINDRMGCDIVWNPSYTESMVRNGLDAWSLDDIVLWQYCGDGAAAIGTLPHEVPNFGKVDLSVYIQGTDKPQLSIMRQRLTGLG